MLNKRKGNIIVFFMLLIGILISGFLLERKVENKIVILETLKIHNSEIPNPVDRSFYPSKSLFEVADSLCKAKRVPFELIKEIGDNESGWRFKGNTTGGSDFGDLQVIDETFYFWYKKLGLNGGKSRRNYLTIGIHYLSWLHKREGSWRRARFAYGRGTWRDESTWTEMEKGFMNKINWKKYDRN